MLVLVNKSAEEVSTTLALDAAKLGVPPNAAWKDLLAGQPMDPAAPVAIKARNYRLIQVGG